MTSTLAARYEQGWSSVDRDCDLCHMEKKTEWHVETQNFVIADTLSGHPFIVSKQHETELSDERWEKMERLLNIWYNEWEITVIMDQYPDHWHAHLTEYSR